MDIKILKDMFLTIERGNLWKRQDQITYKRIMVDLRLLKSGKVELQNAIDRGNLRKIIGIHCKKLTLIVKNIFSEDCAFCKERRDYCTEHSKIWGMFMGTTLNAATFMGKNFSTIQSLVKNHESLTLKQMFDVTAQIVNNEEEINCLDKILYQKNSWTQLSLINDPVIINLQSTKVYVFSDSVLCLGKVLQHPECNEAWKNRVAGVRAERSYRDYDAISGESTEFE